MKTYKKVNIIFLLKLIGLIRLIRMSTLFLVMALEMLTLLEMTKLFIRNRISSSSFMRALLFKKKKELSIQTTNHSKNLTFTSIASFLKKAIIILTTLIIARKVLLQKQLPSQSLKV